MRDLRGAVAEESDPSGPHDRRRHPQRRRRDRVGHHRPERCAASGVAVRRAQRAFPYSGYEHVRVRRVTRTEGDAYARFMVRLDEMDQSMRIIEQVRKRSRRPGR